MLTRPQVLDLKRDFCAGFGPCQAARRRGFAYGTVRAYYDRFIAADVPRGSRRGRVTAVVYRGPDWIGEPATVTIERRVPRGHIDYLPASDSIGA